MILPDARRDVCRFLVGTVVNFYSNRYTLPEVFGLCLVKETERLDP